MARPRRVSPSRARASVSSSSSRPIAPFVARSKLTEDRLAAIVEMREQDGIVYQLEHVKCGRRRCWCREAYPDGGHGPYWYAYFVDERSQRWHARYIGKNFREI